MFENVYIFCDMYLKLFNSQNFPGPQSGKTFSCNIN